jgi:hypothetical protein
VAQLCQRKDELDQANAQVLVIGFGAEQSARHWLEQTCDLFPLLLDPEREVYRKYNLKASWLLSWNPRTLRFYIRALRSGRKWRGIQGRSNQLGGDFIVGADGIIRLAYRSSEATDRPEIENLLALLHTLHEDRDPR